ncbi:uncharacterized protein LY79DRAFT_539880 [Colletotrichum navitas]|uniref:Uncharacterized protein n=1 Tax=Colletotrichum navitas TaxID=681940 RepID=A0AAD8VA95_9PEZI|nr:uncharacterized protein LY79DRAFT_539880 [Colletotrichum navitas]KAK1597993.1 hypothetical protein LY79DRAFT_539880 [Colletotrichum navitas]
MTLSMTGEGRAKTSLAVLGFSSFPDGWNYRQRLSQPGAVGLSLLVAWCWVSSYLASYLGTYLGR